MVTNLSRVVLAKISKPGLKLKLLPFLTESIISFEIFSEHLWLLSEFNNNYLYNVTKLMTSLGSFQ